MDRWEETEVKRGDGGAGASGHYSEAGGESLNGVYRERLYN